jgi:hypothetical protein
MLLKDDLGFEYYETKPKEFKMVTSPSEFLCLKPNKRKFTEENTEVVVGSEYVVYSPHSGRYYLRRVHEYSNPFSQSALLGVIRKGRVFIKYTPEIRKQINVQYQREKVHYSSLVIINELIYELDFHEKWGKFRDDRYSNRARIEGDIERLSKNKIKTVKK